MLGLQVQIKKTQLVFDEFKILDSGLCPVNLKQEGFVFNRGLEFDIVHGMNLDALIVIG